QQDHLRTFAHALALEAAQEPQRVGAQRAVVDAALAVAGSDEMDRFAAFGARGERVLQRGKARHVARRAAAVKWIVERGRRLTRASHSTRCPGTRKSSQRCASVTTCASISASASGSPMQARGPSPNGR